MKATLRRHDHINSSDHLCTASLGIKADATSGRLNQTRYSLTDLGIFMDYPRTHFASTNCVLGQRTVISHSRPILP